MGTNFVILNSPQAALSLLQKKADISSARPSFFFCMNLVGWRETVIMTSDMNWLKGSRHLILSDVGSASSLSKLTTLFEEEARKFTLRILEDPSWTTLAAQIRL
jgi:hypothetical protein